MHSHSRKCVYLFLFFLVCFFQGKTQFCRGETEKIFYPCNPEAYSASCHFPRKKTQELLSLSANALALFDTTGLQIDSCMLLMVPRLLRFAIAPVKKSIFDQSGLESGVFFSSFLISLKTTALDEGLFPYFGYPTPF